MCGLFSIVYIPLDASHFCSTKDGTFGTLEMLLSHEVDVIFGPVCSSGMRRPMSLEHTCIMLHARTRVMAVNV